MNEQKAKTTTRRRNREITRQALLDAAFDEIYRRGFQAASLDSIVAKVGITKGALYYHFSSKVELGYAVIQEMVKPRIDNLWLPQSAQVSGGDTKTDYLDRLIDVIKQNFDDMRPDICEFGCPLNNLAQEMSPIDDEFRRRLDELFHYWRSNLASFIRSGQERGEIDASVDVAESSGFIVAAIEGIISTYKSNDSRDSYPKMGRQLIQYLETMRPKDFHTVSRKTA